MSKKPAAPAGSESEFRKIVAPDAPPAPPSGLDAIWAPAASKPAPMFPLWSDEELGAAGRLASGARALPVTCIYVLL